MDSLNLNTLVLELQRRAEWKFGPERAEALRHDLQQLAVELAALDACDVEFNDEP